jgi:hypothetical protein
LVWVPREPPLEELTDIDSDVEPVEVRRRDLGVPDGLWWALSVGVGGAGFFALMAALDPLVGERPAFFTATAWMVAAAVFAKQRWGHRRYRTRRALRDAGKILGTGLALTLLWTIIAAVAPELAARLP